MATCLFEILPFSASRRQPFHLFSRRVRVAGKNSCKAACQSSKTKGIGFPALNAPRAFRSSSSPWKKPHANQLSYGSLAGMDKVTTHIMGLPSTAFTDGQPSFLKGLRVGGGGIHHGFFLSAFCLGNVKCGPTRARAADLTVISRTL